MRSSTVEGRAGRLGGEFSLSAPSGTLGERRGDRGRREVKLSVVGMTGENITPCWTVAVFDGRRGEHVRRGAFGVDGGSTTFKGVRKGFESCDISVVSEPSSLSVAARVDEVLHENAGSSVAILCVSSTASTVSACGLSTTFTSLPQTFRQLVSAEGQPSSGTGNSA